MSLEVIFRKLPNYFTPAMVKKMAELRLQHRQNVMQCVHNFMMWHKQQKNAPPVSYAIVRRAFREVISLSAAIFFKTPAQLAIAWAKHTRVKKQKQTLRFPPLTQRVVTLVKAKGSTVPYAMLARELSAKGFSITPNAFASRVHRYEKQTGVSLPRMTIAAARNMGLQYAQLRKPRHWVP